MLVVSNLNLPFVSHNTNQPIIGQVAQADEGNYLPYDAGTSILVSRTTEHGYPAIDFGTQRRIGINARAVRSGRVIRNAFLGSPDKPDFGWVVYIRYDNNHIGI